MLGLKNRVDLRKKFAESKNIVMKTTVESRGSNSNVTEIERLSDLEKQLRVTVFVVRFVSNLKKAVNKFGGMCGEFVLKKLVVVEKLWVKCE